MPGENSSERIASLLERYREIRSATQALIEPLEIEDMVVQSMPDVSPTKWHLAHTTWFFETFALKPTLADYSSPGEHYHYLFNSYYNALGDRHPRPERGLLSRPTVAEVLDYRHYVDECIFRLLASETVPPGLLDTIEIGLNHEQQHQELMLTDVKHVLYQNPARPAYAQLRSSTSMSREIEWVEHNGGVIECGFAGQGFSFDNEGPRHRVFLEPFALASRLVTVGEYRQFIADGGYRRPEFWLSDGWTLLNSERIDAPLYWDLEAGTQFTLYGELPLDPDVPLTHVSYYEADAFANWASEALYPGARLPIEVEWEVSANEIPIEETARRVGFHPFACDGKSGMQQLYHHCWQWTRSAYLAYPGYKPDKGAIGEYNGKFMSGQMVLRGGSVATPRGHLRATYRNFFQPGARWQFSGIRLARDVR